MIKDLQVSTIVILIMATKNMPAKSLLPNCSRLGLLKRLLID
jgi:hypothetical protein